MKYGCANHEGAVEKCTKTEGFFLPLTGSVAIFLAAERQARLALQFKGCLHGLGQLLLLLEQSTGDLWISARSDFLQNVLYTAATASHHHWGYC